MAEPGNIPPVPPVPPGGSPFNPNVPAATRPGPGCSKPLLIGCGALVLVVGICFLIIVWQIGKDPGRALSWTVSQMENAITTALPQDVTAEEREQLKAAFAGVRQKTAAGQLSAEQLQTINFKFLEISRKEGGMTRQDVLELTAMLEGLAGSTTEVANPSPQSGAEPVSQAP